MNRASQTIRMLRVPNLSPGSLASRQVSSEMGRSSEVSGSECQARGGGGGRRRRRRELELCDVLDGDSPLQARVPWGIRLRCRASSSVTPGPAEGRMSLGGALTYG